MNTFSQNQQPLGSEFNGYTLNQAINHYTLDPFQYSITKFNYNIPKVKDSSVTFGEKSFKNDPGLVYKDVDFEKLIPAYTAEKKSVNDFPAQSYHRFLANDGYFNPLESIDNTDLWYYQADANQPVTGASLNVQEVQHIIFPEPQRGGLNTKQLSKYSATNNETCEFFNYNNRRGHNNFNDVYGFDSNYCRYIGISSPTSGTMPFVN